MIIKDVHIDNYGKYSNRSFTGFSEGVNVVYGPNEHGKTTLLEFIRRMLFGFPKKNTAKNRFEPVNSNNPGGRLICSLDSGEELAIERQGWTKGGAVKLNSVNSPASELNRLLRSSEQFYHNVYAITIEELYSVDSLNGEDIKNRIYGAGLDLGNVSLAAVKKYFQSKGEAIFKPSGSKQLIHELNEQKKALEQQIKLANNNLNRYAEIMAEKEENSAAAENLRKEIQAINARSLELSAKISALSDFIDFEAANRELNALPPAQTVSREDVDESRELSGELKRTSNALEKIRVEDLEIQEKIKKTVVNSALLEMAPEITMLERSAERYRADSHDSHVLREKIAVLKKRIEAKRGDIASVLADNQDLEGLNFDLDFISIINDFDQKFVNRRQQEMTAQVIQQQLAQNPESSLAKTVFPALVLVVGFIAVIITALLLAQPQIAVLISVLTGIPVTLLLMKILNAKTSDVKNEESLKSAFAELETGWKKLLAENGFKEHLSPGDLLKCAEIYRDCQREQNELADLEEDLKAKALWLQKIEKVLEKTGEAAGKHNLTNEVIADIEIISGISRNNEKADEELKKLRDEHVKKQKLLDATQNKIGSLESQLNEMRKRFKLEDLRELPRLLAEKEKSESLQDKLNDSLNRLRKIFGLDAEIGSIREELANFSNDEAKQEIAALEAKRGELERYSAKLNQEIGRLEEEQGKLVSGDELTALRNEHERIVQQIRNHAALWAEFKAAEILLGSAVNKYEQERQPEVINRATAIFKKLTGGNYVNIRKPAESEELLLVGAKGASRRVIELSRGTREQLYLAMRLGLIEHYEQKTERLPVVFDDILVNFDETRFESALEAIFEFARKRQVIVLTCHEKTHSLLLKYGAQDIV